MKSYPTTRYKCDHCNKRGGSKHHMARHEVGCTNNPNRACGMCALAGFEQRTIQELSAIYVSDGFKALLAACDECPACTLAAMRQTDHSRFEPEYWADEKWYEGDWKFKLASASFLEAYGLDGGYRWY